MSGTEAARSRGCVGAIAYFQAFTGTFCDAADLEGDIAEALACGGVLGVAVATRPDCLPPQMLDMLEEVSRKTFLWVELGMQTRWGATLEKMSRGHGHDATVMSAMSLRARGIRTVLHLILGLPGEDRDMILESSREASRLAPWGIKFHPLHITRGSGLEPPWRRGEIPLLKMDEYAGLVADSIELLPPDTTIHRMTGERPGGRLLAPEWCREKGRVIASILGELARRGSRQGARWSPA